MKILVVGQFDSYATSKPLAEMLIGLQNDGERVHVVASKFKPVAANFDNAGIPVYDHHPVKKIDSASIKYLSALMSKIQPDILFLLNSKSIPNGIRAARGKDVKIITYRGAAGLYWHDPMAYLTHLDPRIDGIVCLSSFVERNIQKQMFFQKTVTRVIHHGFDRKWYSENEPDADNKSINNSDEIVIGCIANNRQVKGIKYLLEASQAFNSSKKVKFLLVGAGLQAEIDKMKSRGMDTSNLKAVGFVEDLRPIYKQFDIYVQPSLSEGLGKSIVECMLNGIPVIATKSGGPEELIIDQESGLLIDKKSSDQLGKAIQSLIDSAPLRKKVGS